MMMLTGTHPLDNISTADAALVAVLGYGVVFLGLILLMIVVIAIGKVFIARSKKTVTEEPAAPVVEAPKVAAPTAPGTAGQLKLHDVEPKTAAMIMAIVADKLGKPLNELRFTSIKEVK